jgi:hypothetical protein
MKLYSQTRSRSDRRCRGGALVLVALATAGLAVLALSVTSLGLSSSKEQRGTDEHLSSLYVAEAGVSDGYATLAAAGSAGIQPGSTIGTLNPTTYDNASYSVTRTNNADGTISLVSTGTLDHSDSRVELILKRDNNSIYRYGAFGELGVTITSNAKVDSYNSTLGPYVNQAVNGFGSNSYALAHGNVGSNGNIRLKQNAMVKGNLQPGPGGSAMVIGNATVSGSISPASTPQALPPINVPTVPTSGALVVPSNATMNLSSGSYHWSSAGLSNGSTVNVTGPATLICDSLRLQSNSKMVIDASAGPVNIYVINDFVMGYNTRIYPTSYNPADLTVNLQSDNIIDPDMIVDLDQIDFQSNSYMYGTIYAPHAKVTVNSNFELYGALIARDLVLDSWSRVHFDEQLLNVNSNNLVTYSRVCFRVLAAP